MNRSNFADDYTDASETIALSYSKICDKTFLSEQNMQLHTVKAHSYEDGLLHCDKEIIYLLHILQIFRY